MTRKEAVKELKEVLCGESGHTTIRIWKDGRSYRTYTTTGRICIDDIEEEEAIFYHSMNECTAKEASNQLSIAGL